MIMKMIVLMINNINDNNYNDNDINNEMILIMNINDYGNDINIE